MKRKIIGHRGAAGLELENTAASFKRALALGAQTVELDVRLTKDKQLVVSHDADMERIADNPTVIREASLASLQKIRLRDGSKILTLAQALAILANVAVIVELKDAGSARILLKELAKHPAMDISVASFNLDELVTLRNLAPNLFLYNLEHTKPFECIQTSRMLKLDGVGLNYWLLNPLTYRYAKHSNLAMYVYTVNNRFLARFLGWLYPSVALCTDHPEWFIRKRRGLRSVHRPGTSLKPKKLSKEI